MPVKIIKATYPEKRDSELFVCDKENARYMLLEYDISLKTFNKTEKKCWEDGNYAYYYDSLRKLIEAVSVNRPRLESVTEYYDTFKEAYNELLLIKHLGGI